VCIYIYIYSIYIYDKLDVMKNQLNADEYYFLIYNWQEIHNFCF